MGKKFNRKRLLELAGMAAIGSPQSNSLSVDTDNSSEQSADEYSDDSEVSPGETIEVQVSGEVGAKFKEFIEAIGDQADTGSGVQITATNNGGEEVATLYIDGDGADRISLVSDEDSDEESVPPSEDDQMYESKIVFPSAIVKFLEQQQLEGVPGIKRKTIVEHFGKVANPMLKQLQETGRVKQNDKGLFISTFNTGR